MAFSSKDFIEGLPSRIGYRAIDGEGPFLSLGYDNVGHLTFNVRGHFAGSVPDGTAYISCLDGHCDNGDRLFALTLKDARLEKVFYGLVDNLVRQASGCQTSQAAFDTIKGTFLRWRQLFVREPREMSEEQCLGLMGELLFLRDWAIPSFGEDEAVASWCGSEGTKKDFVHGDDWYEIKSVSRGSDSVTISSLEQLDGQGTGHLVLYRYEKTSEAGGGLTLANLVEWAREGLPIDLADRVVGNAVKRGYSFGTAETSYYFDTAALYRIKEDFPRLTRDDVPSSLKQAKYSLIIAMLDEFKEE